MIDIEGAVLLPVDSSAGQIQEPTTGDSELERTLANLSATPDAPILSSDTGGVGDEWIRLNSTSSSTALVVTMGSDDFWTPQPQGEADGGGDPVITAPRPRVTSYLWDGGSGGDTSGSSGGGDNGGDGGGGSGGDSTAPVPAKPDQQDCGTDDGAAVQVAKQVLGVLPPGVAGPPDPMKSAGGNDWSTVEFGAVIIQNPNGSFGALNDMVYSSDQPGWVALPDTAGQPVQGLWHNHPLRDDLGQQAIDMYPSPRDWDALARIAQPGAAADPSFWVMGPDGVTREFKLSERSFFESLSVDAMKNKEGLAGHERTQSCG
jgi:hypothetical protein